MLARPRPHTHPSRGKASHRIGEAPRPQLLERRGRTERESAGKLDLLRIARELEPSEVDAVTSIVASDLLHCAMHIDRLIISGLPDHRDHALRLAERIGAD